MKSILASSLWLVFFFAIQDSALANICSRQKNLVRQLQADLKSNCLFIKSSDLASIRELWIYLGDAPSKIHFKKEDFKGFTNLSSLSLAQTPNQSYISFEEGAFSGIPLATLSVRGSLDSLRAGMFSGAHKLRTISFDINGSGDDYRIKSIEPGALAGLPALEELYISIAIPITVPGLLTGATSLKKIELPYSVNLPPGVFADLNMVKELRLYSPIFERGSFKGFSSLRKLEIQGTSSQTIPAHAFEGLNNLESLSISSHLKQIEAYAFADLSNLRSLGLSNFSNKSVWVDENAFKGLVNLQNFNQATTMRTEIVFQDIPSELFEDFGQVTNMNFGSGSTIQSAAFAPLKNLNALNLWHPGSYSPGLFDNLSELTYLSLQGPGIFPDQIFNFNKKLRSFSFSTGRNWDVRNIGLTPSCNICINNDCAPPRIWPPVINVVDLLIISESDH